MPLPSPIDALATQFVRGARLDDATTTPPSVVGQALQAAGNRPSDRSSRDVAPPPGDAAAHARPTAASAPTAASPPQRARFISSVAWLDRIGFPAAMEASAAVKGDASCLHVACGVFAYLNSHDEALALPFFRMAGSTGTAGSAVARLQAMGFDVRADLFTHPGLWDSDSANVTSLRDKCPGALVRHVLAPDAGNVRLLIEQLPLGEAAMLFIENAHAVVIARGTDGWHVFDMRLHSADHAAKARTGSRHHVHGAEGDALVDHFLARMKLNPVVVRMAHPATGS